MKAIYLLPIVLAFSHTSCTKSPDVSSSNKNLEKRFQKIEAQLSRIEKNVITQTSEKTTTAPSENEIKIYVSGEVVRPGQYFVEKNISLLAAIAVAGGNTDQASFKNVKITRKGADDKIIANKNGWKDILLDEGDVVIVPKNWF